MIIDFHDICTLHISPTFVLGSKYDLKSVTYMRRYQYLQINRTSLHDLEVNADYLQINLTSLSDLAVNVDYMYLQIKLSPCIAKEVHLVYSNHLMFLLYNLSSTVY